MLLIQINFLNVDLIDFLVQNAADHHSLAFEAMHQVGSVQAIDVCSHRQDHIAAQMRNAIHRASIRRPPHRLRLEHLLMRAGQGMDVIA